MGLQLRNKTPKRRMKAKLRDDRAAALRPNDVWAMDFVHDQLATGRKIRVLTVVDTFSRFSPTVDPRFTYRAEDVVATLERVCARVGYPRTIRVDQGSEFVSRDLDLWAYTRGVMRPVREALEAQHLGPTVSQQAPGMVAPRCRAQVS
jgi:putative transposase